MIIWSMKEMNKCLVLIVEGDTEIEFYKQVITYVRTTMNRKFDLNIEYINVKGVGGFKNIALRKFVKEIQVKYTNYKFTVALCRDTDVFELSPKPPVNWKEIEKAFYDAGVEKVIHIRAKHSIEDWFLYDSEGIKSFLRLPKKTKVSGKNGYDKLKRLYTQANKIYFKGMKSNGMIRKLDIEKIMNCIKHELNPLYKELGIK